MVVETIVVIAHAQCLVPCQTMLLPILKPFHFRAGLTEELHFHLLKFAHAEHKLSCHNLIAKGFTYLTNTERKLHATRLLHIQIVYKYALRSLRAQINFIGLVAQ